MNTIDQLAAFAASLGCIAEQDVPMCRYTTFKTGGCADLLLTPTDETALASLVRRCTALSIDFLIVGNGSNLLVSDEGIRGAVLHLGEGFSKIEARENGVIRCGAGLGVARLCAFALQQGLSGLEFAYGIPGSTGGAVFMNAGAYGGEMKQVVSRCFHVTPQGEAGSLSGEALDFDYRHSAYRDNGFVITSVEFKLQPGDPREIRARMDELLMRRKTKQPLDYPSAGSVFKRPDGCYAGALIEQCGLKGCTVGGAQVSEKHAGFIINTGSATSADVTGLIRLVQERVQAGTGVMLEPEVMQVGPQIGKA